MNAHDQVQTPEPEDEPIAPGRRELLKAMAAGGSWVMARAILPAVWSAPVVAGMALPEHAQASCRNTVQVDPPSSSASHSWTNAVLVDHEVVSTLHDTVKITVTVTAQDELIAERTQFQLYERSEAEDGTSYVCVVALITPSDDATFSRTRTITLERPGGTYAYQLRWDGGHTEWREINAWSGR